MSRGFPLNKRLKKKNWGNNFLDPFYDSQFCLIMMLSHRSSFERLYCFQKQEAMHILLPKAKKIFESDNQTKLEMLKENNFTENTINHLYSG